MLLLLVFKVVTPCKATCSWLLCWRALHLVKPHASSSCVEVVTPCKYHMLLRFLFHCMHSRLSFVEGRYALHVHALVVNAFYLPSVLRFGHCLTQLKHSVVSIASFRAVWARLTGRVFGRFRWCIYRLLKKIPSTFASSVQIWQIWKFKSRYDRYGRYGRYGQIWQIWAGTSRYGRYGRYENAYLQGVFARNLEVRYENRALNLTGLVQVRYENRAVNLSLSDQVRYEKRQLKIVKLRKSRYGRYGRLRWHLTILHRSP